MGTMIELVKVKDAEINELSILATKIVREHYDPIIGKAQNDYMLNKFQSVEGINKQISEGYIFYWAIFNGSRAGFFSYTYKEDKLYISKLYIDKAYRGNKIASEIIQFLTKEARKENLSKIFLNVNKRNDETINIYKHLGFKILREEKNPIGEGFYMDDYVYELSI